MVTKPTGQNYPSNTRTTKRKDLIIMKGTKLYRKIAALALVAIMACCMAASALGPLYSSYVSFYGNGLSYIGRSILYDDGGGVYRVGGEIKTENGAAMGYGTVGLMPQLISSTGNVIVTARGKTNNSETNFFYYNPDTSYGASGPVACLAWVSVDGGLHYNFRLRETNVAGYSRSADWEAQIAVLAETTLTEDGAYPVNAAGETYGSVLLAAMAGQNPDLVSATNQKGVDGYIRIADVPTIGLDESAAAIQAIPLYDMNGNVIGSFELEAPETASAETVQSIAG